MFKAFTFGLVLLASFAAPAPASADAATFDDGLRAYAEGDYDAARRVYEQLVKQGSTDPSVFLNLGHAEYRADRKVQAAINYRRALALDPANSAARSSHEHVLGELGIPADGLDLPQMVGQYISFDLLVLLGSLLFWAGLLLVVFALFSAGNHRGLVVGGVFLALLGATAVALSWQGDSRIALARMAMVTEGTPALSAPSANSQKLTDLRQTDLVRVVASRDDWSLVKLPIGVEGWVRSNMLEPVFPGALPEVP
ncbi:MAG: tetratricopeptide repeat protein [Chthoniobacterales bacterium]